MLLHRWQEQAWHCWGSMLSMIIGRYFEVCYSRKFSSHKYESGLGLDSGFIIGLVHFGIQPLSDTVPLWSGSSFGAFVFIGNDGCMFTADCKHNNHKDKCRFFDFRVSGKTLFIKFSFPPKEMTYAIAIVNKKSCEPHCVIWKWASAI